MFDTVDAQNSYLDVNNMDNTVSPVTQPDASYEIAQRVTLTEAPGLRVRMLSLSQGQNVPWHLHQHTTDTFYCLEGSVEVKTRRPDGLHVLEPGDSCAITPGTAHYVNGVDGQSCRFIIIQGVGLYDYVVLND